MDKDELLYKNTDLDSNSDSNSKSQEKEDSPTSDSTDTKNTDTNNSIYFVGGEKGGVGKSFLSRCMLDYFINRGWGEQLTLVEADPTIDDVSSVYGECHERVTFSDNKFARDEPDLIIDRAESKTVIVNLPSNVCKQFDMWASKAGIFSDEAKEYYSDIVYFFVSDGCYRSIERFLAQLKNYSMEDLPHCLVLNPGRRTCHGDFSYLQDFKPLMKALKKYEIPVLCLPELSSSMQFKCDLDRISYREMGNVPNQQFSFRQNIRTFLSEVDSLFDEIFPEAISSPQGLLEITKNQDQYIKKGKLPPNVI